MIPCEGCEAAGWLLEQPYPNRRLRAQLLSPGAPELLGRAIPVSDNCPITVPGWREVLIAVVAIAAFPRLASIAWTRRGPRAVVARIAFSTAVGFAARTWLAPWFKRVTAVQEELRRQLGREPTETEVMDRVRAAYGR